MFFIFLTDPFVSSTQIHNMHKQNNMLLMLIKNDWSMVIGIDIHLILR